MSCARATWAGFGAAERASVATGARPGRSRRAVARGVVVEGRLRLLQQGELLQPRLSRRAHGEGTRRLVEAQIHELLDFLDSNHMGWSTTMAPRKCGGTGGTPYPPGGDARHLRHQLEFELRGKLIRLRELRIGKGGKFLYNDPALYQGDRKKEGA